MHQLRKAKVEHFDKLAAFATNQNHHVFWLQVTVDHALFVRVAKPHCNVTSNRRSPSPGQGPTLDHLGQIFSVEKLHDQEQQAIVGLSKISDPDNALVIEP